MGIDLTPLAFGNRTRGIGVYAENLVAALMQVDTRNDYFLVRSPDDSNVNAARAMGANFRNVFLLRVPLGRAAPLVTHQLLLPLLAQRLELDVWHSIALSYNPSIPGAVYWQCVPTVITVHDLSPLVLSNQLLKRIRYRWFYRLQLAACRRAAHLCADSENTARDLVRFEVTSAERITAIPLAVPALASSETPLSPSVRELVTSPYLLHVGGAEPQKNQETVLRVFGELCKDVAFRLRLVLVGQRHLDDTLAVERSPHAAGRIVRLANVTRADLDALYAHCAVFLFPSWYEGFGLPVLEAMQGGAPVVAANTSSLPEVAGDAAILIAPEDVEGMAQAVRQLLADATLRARYVQAGCVRAAQFSWTRTAEQTRDVYRQVVGGK